MLAELMLIASLVGGPDSADDSTAPRAETAPDAHLPMKCFPRDRLLKAIKDRSGAVPLFIGTVGSERAMEVWRDTVHPGEQWVAFVTESNGLSCILGSGSGFGLADPGVAPKPSPVKPL